MDKKLIEKITVLNKTKDDHVLNNTLIVSGPSGCGKTYLVKKLVNDYSEIFNRTHQFTTRPKRYEAENDYFYVTKDEFEIIKDKLIGITFFNNNTYGSILTTNPDKINLIILDYFGMVDFVTKYDNNFNDIQNKVRFNIVNFDTSEYKNKRDGRSEEFFQKERFSYYFQNDEYKESNDLINKYGGYHKFDVTKNYLDINDLLKYLELIDFIKIEKHI
jgi:hypothetical protein